MALRARVWEHLSPAEREELREAANLLVTSALSEKKDSELPPAECYVLAIHQSIGSILSPYAAKKIMDRAKDLSNGN